MVAESSDVDNDLLITDQPIRDLVADRSRRVIESPPVETGGPAAPQMDGTDHSDRSIMPYRLLRPVIFGRARNGTDLAATTTSPLTNTSTVSYSVPEDVLCGLFLNYCRLCLR